MSDSRRSRISAALLAVAAAALGCGGVEPVVECAAVGRARPVCGLQNPEDLALLPSGAALLVSQFGGMEGSKSGSLARFDLASDGLSVLYAGGGAAPPTPGWGDPACPGPPTPAFSPHGIDLARRPDGHLQLLVVNHGGRESIEVFEVSEGRGRAALAWRGCVLPPDGSFLNDVATLPGGGFVVTHMFPKRGALGQMVSMLRGALGADIGYVLEWRPGRGFAVVPGSGGPFPNGVEVSPTGDVVYVNYYLGGEVRRIDRASGEVLARADVPSPDNSAWGEDGRLLVASHRGSFVENTGCLGLEGGACPMRFAIVALDATTLEGEPIYENEGPPMGGGTVALQVRGELLIGSFAGDRLLRVAPSGG